MQYRALGTSGIQISVIGLGSWPMSGMAWGKTDDAEAMRTIQAAIDAGVNLIDTAESYGRDGHAETLIGQAIAGRRAEVVLATKISPHHLSAANVAGCLEGSLRRLSVDYIDLYQVHRPNPNVPMEETMPALQRLRQEGKVRVIGVCNFSCELLEKALQYGPVVACQSPYSLLERAIERNVLAFCRERRLGVLAHSCLGKNLLSGQIRRGVQLPPDDPRLRLDALFRDGSYERHFDAVEALNCLAAHLGRPMAQVAINWVIQQPGITAALVGMRRVEHLRENVAALDWQLSTFHLDTLAHLTQSYV